MSRLHLLRHLPAAGAEGRAIGRTDLPLADAAQAARLAEAWPHAVPRRLVASPLARAQQTAAALGQAWDLPVETEPALTEVDFGDWDGQTWAEIEQTDGDALAAWMAEWTTTPAPAGESFADVQARVGTWLESIDQAEETVAVAHAGSIRAVLVHVLGLEAAHAFRLVVTHGALTTVRLSPPELIILNRPL
ncbi:MAG: histidine phosphatase family protein [Bacteroidota bacterium]